MGWLSRRGKSSEAEDDGLLKALRDTDLNICLKAAEIARQQKRKDAVPALIELLYKPGTLFRPLRIAVARALGEIGDLRALQHLGEANYCEPWPEGEEVLSVIQEAQSKLWQQPSAEQYLAKLGRIVMYRMENFWRSNDIYIDPDIQTREGNQFTMNCAKRFFVPFLKEYFAFEGKVGSIRIYDGKEALPRHSYAFGWLYSDTIDEIMRHRGTWPEHPVGTINFEYGGNAKAPYISVQPEPDWPVPSIVRRLVIDGGTGVRFEEKS